MRRSPWITARRSGWIEAARGRKPSGLRGAKLAAVRPRPFWKVLGMATLLAGDWSVRRHEDLAAALALLSVLQRGLDVLDRVDLLDGRRQHALQDLTTEVGVDCADLLERAPRERATEDEADQRLSAGDQRGP